MSIKTELAKYGSGVGYIYLTDVDDNIVQNVTNDAQGRDYAERKMLVSSVLTSNISASSNVEVTSAGGDITNLSYNGVSVFDVASPVTGATTDDLATNLAIAINAHISVPEYTAVSSGSNVIVYLDPAEGSSLNGTVGASATTGTAALAVENLDGGSYSTGEVDSQIGFKMYLNSSLTAPLDSLVGATDVTSGVLRKSSSSPYEVKQVEIVSDSISVDRDGAVTVVDVQTEGAIASDDLTSIDAGIFSDGDTIILRSQEAAKVTTVKEGGNIELSNNADFITGTKDFAIVLQYSTVDNTWYEINRSPGNDLDVASLRSAGIAVPTQGVTTEVINLSGATTTLTPGVEKGYYNLTGTGSLTGSVSYNFAAGLVDGDTFIVDYNGLITIGAFGIFIGGVLLTQRQSAEGNVVVRGVWDSANAIWVMSVFRDTQSADLTDDSQLGAKEDDLGLPAQDGDVLASTTGGVRSWVSNNTDIALDGSATTSSSTAAVETTLRTVTIPAATLTTNGSAIILKYSGQFGANADPKTFKGKFNGTDVVQNLINTAPNGADFVGEIMVSRAGSTVVKVGSSLIINGNTIESNFIQIGSINLDTTSYDITLTGIGALASDVNIYSSIATKIIV